MAVVAMGTTLKKGTGGAGTVIAGLTSIGGLELSADVIDTTVLDSPSSYRTFTASFKDSGEISLEGYYDYDSHSGLLADFEAGTANAYTITFPDTSNWSFNAVVTAFQTGAELEDLVSFSSTLKVSGKPTLTGAP
jgi:predicted secreted protein